MSTDSNTLLERARRWLDEVRELDNTASQVGRFGLLAALAAAMLSGLAMGLAASLGLTQGVNPVAAYTGLIGLGVVLAFVWLRPGATRVLSLAACAAVSLTILLGTVDNGLRPLAVWPAAVALLHLTMRPGPALALSMGTLLGILLILFVRHAVDDQALLLRLIISSVVSILLWQLATRFWRTLTLRMRDLGTEMSVAVAQLEAEREEARRMAQKVMKTDAATGLLNRQGFIEVLGERLKSPASSGVHGLVVAIRLLAWNDATAHRDALSQEQLLQALLVRLREPRWLGAVLARSGTDAYLAWLPASEAGLQEVHQACIQRARALEAAITVGSASAPTQPRIGVSEAPVDGIDAATLIAHAELASLAAVRMGQAQPVRYTPALQAAAEDRDRLAQELVAALTHGGLALHYQPLVSPEEPGLRKAEGLIRWQHPTRGSMPPGHFIPLAEQTDLIIGVTDWVLREAAQQVKRWRDTLHPRFQISVNIPPAYLNLCVREPAQMLDRLQALQVPPGAMVLEITEGVMLEVTPELIQVLALLRALGFQIALDDFGVGYSNFGQIDKLRLDFLKLDKTFVDDLGVREERRPICRSIVTMAHELGFKVVAEGVETELQSVLLAQLGADFLQGYLFSRPIAATELEAWAAARAPMA